MQLGRFQVSTLKPAPILSITYTQDGRHFAVAGESGYEIWRTYPLGLVRRRSLPGTLGLVLPLPLSPLIILQGGGATPLYPPNKAVIYHDSLGIAVAELEFGERIRGITARAFTIIVALSRRVIAFEFGLGSVTLKGKGKAKEDTGFSIRKSGEWETVENEAGLMAVATSPESTLLALPGRQAGHIQLVHLPPCPYPPSSSSKPLSTYPPAPFRSPIILAHDHSLSAISCTASGSHILTTSDRGTLLRVWDTARGRLVRELRRGVDRAQMWGMEFEDSILTLPVDELGEERRRVIDRRKGGRVVGWSDKGTIHVWDHSEEQMRHIAASSSTHKPTAASPPSLTNLISRNLPLPKYFTSTPSFAQYRLPRKNPHALATLAGAAVEVATPRNPNQRSEAEREIEEKELAERFVVSWIEVEVEEEEKVEDVVEVDDKVKVGHRLSLGGSMGIGMGTREERRSFGSDATSTRTATPVCKRQTSGNAPSFASVKNTQRTSSGSHIAFHANVKPKEDLVKRIKKERQLIAITYSGDWYRLRLPLECNEHESRDTKCELVEYRRLRVGGGGW